MKKRFRKLTITLDERIARWADMEATKTETRISRLVGNILEDGMAQQDEYAKAMKRALRRKPFLKSDGTYLLREEAHDRGGPR